MTIAVDTRFTNAGSPFDAGYLCSLAEKYPAHHFLFIADKAVPENRTLPVNATPVVAGPAIKNSLLLQYWFHYKLPALLRKHKADVFVGLQGICPLRTGIPQCLVINDTSFISEPSFFLRPHTRYYKKNMDALLTKATSIAVFSDFSMTVLAGEYKTDASKAVLTGADLNNSFVAISEDEKERVKETYAAGKEYFLTRCENNPRSNMMNLLKAFSFFKKRQKSHMLLLLAGRPQQEIIHSLKTYKFRSEVILLPDTDATETAKITAAAYALLHPVLYEDTGLAALQAMQCGVPVICSHLGALPEICGDAALYTHSAGFEDIAQKMMQIFKDEDRAKQMIQAGKKRADGYRNNRSHELLWSLIKKAANG